MKKSTKTTMKATWIDLRAKERKQIFQHYSRILPDKEPNKNKPYAQLK